MSWSHLTSKKHFLWSVIALGHGIGDVLMQEAIPLSFESSQLKGKKLQKCIYEKTNVGHTTCN
jgi:hypothetical protein